MANVRIDQNGLAKGPVYEWTAPAAHRSGVTAVDAADPSGTSGAVDAAGYEQCRFDIALTGTAIASLDVQVLFWNARQSLWFGGGESRFVAAGRYALVADARGAIVFLKVIAFSGTSFSLGADYCLS